MVNHYTLRACEVNRSFLKKVSYLRLVNNCHEEIKLPAQHPTCATKMNNQIYIMFIYTKEPILPYFYKFCFRRLYTKSAHKIDVGKERYIRKTFTYTLPKTCGKQSKTLLFTIDESILFTNCYIYKMR